MRRRRFFTLHALTHNKTIKLFRIHTSSQEPRTNMMLGDNTPSLLYNTSCSCEDNDRTEDSSTGENMKQPLIIIMSNESSLKDEEQTKLSQERPSRSIVCIQSFLFGSCIAFALQGIAFVACHTLGPSTPGSLLRNYFSKNHLVLASQLDAVIFVIFAAGVGMTLTYTITKSGSLFLRKKLDKEDDSATASNPSSVSSSIWTARMLFIAGFFYFADGALVGSAFVFLRTGMVLPWIPFLKTMMGVWVLFLIAVEYFEWRSRQCWHQTTDKELEDDLCFLV
jgi:Mn2+/Fe2+ NRAMP family transporter